MVRNRLKLPRQSYFSYKDLALVIKIINKKISEYFLVPWINVHEALKGLLQKEETSVTENSEENPLEVRKIFEKKSIYIKILVGTRTKTE